MHKSTNLLLLFLLIVIFDHGLGQIEYPEHFETDKRKTNAAGRVPVFSPTRCRQHELLYPGDQEHDWICDCAPAAVYYPETDACYPAFRQGPCKPGEIIVLGVNKVIPECIVNECKDDGKIKINNQCYTFGQSPPCQNAELSYVLGVDPDSLKVNCVKLSISFKTRFGVDADEATSTTSTTSKTPITNINAEYISNSNPCARGTKRAIQGRCPETN